MPEMLAGAQLWLFRSDFALDFARPLQPNGVLIASPMLGLLSDEEVRVKALLPSQGYDSRGGIVPEG